MGIAVERDLRVVAEIARTCDPGLELYVFGSALTATEHPDDLDILVIYRDARHVDHLRQLLYTADLDLPLDLVALTPEEETHYRFIARTGAVRLRLASA
ncbi:nucleotidyltransferase domain-containing protein [Actinokineospora globicatena]|uniref:nucleotidyltransferase domain-containing protein n=1 Tax=Actinokineospora globicatena TaxID=103729 RepID=UPI0020A3DA27|nr:nucleotidyltransferase domain-containing protein [Actinokineospora globicatena]MCP2303855.1 Nucleotidyltransferase domain [Actinokineospora globicatena]GLW78988.1 hypothetical protein Aglo01_34700 [Actinokineospora globicatena]GLW86601.1 hypothetical protein Aglo02_42400 [Actinokineospora globicatena]